MTQDLFDLCSRFIENMLSSPYRKHVSVDVSLSRRSSDQTPFDRAVSANFKGFFVSAPIQELEEFGVKGIKNHKCIFISVSFSKVARLQLYSSIHLGR